MKGELSQLDVKINKRLETHLQGFKDDFKGEIISELNTFRFELHGLVEQYYDSPIGPSNAIVQDRGKGVMGSRPRLPCSPSKRPIKVT